MRSYSAPLKRFKLVVALGIAAGAALALTAAYKIDFDTLPPKLTAREQPTYSAGTQLEVSSPVQPYFRSAIDVPVVAAARRAEEEPTNLVEQDEPSIQTLIAAANVYPYLIEGDAVKALREQLFGELEGEVEATAIGATITPSRFEPGRLPFIQIVVTSDTPQHAIRLAQNTADAFIRYVELQQQRGNIRPAQRLVVKQLRKPAKTFEMGGPSPSLPILIFVAVVAVALGAAYMLDRLFPRRPEPAPVDESGEVRRLDEREQLVAHEA